MVVIKKVSAKSILDSRKEKTIFVSIKTNIGEFSASAPNGKSKGKNEAKPYKVSLEEDIKTLKKFNNYFSQEILEKFDDLRRVEDILEGHVGANSFVAFEYAVLKAIAREQKKDIWQLINPKANKFPRLVGNCIGGGEHSQIKQKPDFQEFLLIPKTRSVKKALEINKKAKQELEYAIEKRDKDFKGQKNDEDAWEVSFTDKEVLDLVNQTSLPFGIDAASSTFYKRKKYNYKNPRIIRTSEEQFEYLSNLVKNYNLVYLEDGFYEEDFESPARFLSKFPNLLVVGDDLTTTNYKRLKKAIEMKSINAIIIKPNQIGSLMEVKRVCELAKSENIALVFSHRSGETEDSTLADLAFGFGADFFKCGITGKEREAKLNRLIEIEKRI